LFGNLRDARVCQWTAAGGAVTTWTSTAPVRLQNAHLTLLATMCGHREVQARRELVAILDNAATPVARDLLFFMTRDADPWTVLAAATALLRQDDERGWRPLEDLGRHREWQVRQVVADTLGMSGSARALDALLSLTNNNDYDVRRSTMMALGRLGLPKALPALQRALERDSDQTVKARSAEALAKLAEPIDRAAASVLMQDKDPVNQYRGAMAALRLGVAGGAEVLTMLAGNVSPHVSQMAAEALCEANPSLDQLLALARNAREDVRAIAAKALARSTAGAAFAALRDMLASDTPPVKTAVLEGMGGGGDPLAREALIGACRSEAAAVAIAALKALARRGERLPRELLLAWADDGHAHLRAAGSRWLAGVRDPVALQKLLQRASDESPEVRANAVVALAEFDEPRAFEALVGAFGSAPWQVQLGGALGLELMGEGAVDRLMERIGGMPDGPECARMVGLLADLDHSAKPRSLLLERSGSDTKLWIRVAHQAAGDADMRVKDAMIAALASKDLRIRQTAAETLGAVGDGNTVEPLTRLLGEPDWELRAAAKASLARIGATAVEVLRRGLGVPNRRIRAAIADLLGKLEAPQPKLQESKGALVGALADESRLVRANAAASLGAIGDADAVEPLIRALEDADRGVRNRAAESLKQLGTPEALTAVRAWTVKRRRPGISLSP
jgi:HEAT repeat protein